LFVELTGPGPQQRNAFQTDQVGQRVPINHRSTLAG
jgi:hypothetical protein